MKKDNITAISVILTLILIVTTLVYYKTNIASFNEHSNHSRRKFRSDQKYNLAHISAYEVHGIDVSHHQGDIVWNKVKHPDSARSIDFVFIRATVGTRQDSKFAKNWKQAKKHGFTRGAYHYYWPNVNSEIQARNFISKVKMEKGDLPPVLDIEKTSRVQSVANLRKGLKNWIAIVEKHYGVKPIVYTGDKFYDSYLKPDRYFREYPNLWIANYNRVSEPYSKWHFWQFSERTKISGINELVDFNVFNGSIEDLLKLTKK